MITHLLKESILQLCKASIPCDNDIEIDGIVCITMGKDNEQIVVKVHEKIYTPNSPKSQESKDSEFTSEEEHVLDRNKTESQKKILANESKRDNRNKVVSSGVRIQDQNGSSDMRKGCIIKIDDSDDEETARLEFNAQIVRSREIQHVSCEYCQMVMASNKALITHWTAKHNAYVCLECCKPFQKRSNYTRHVKMHQNRAQADDSLMGAGMMQGVWRCGICEEEHTSELTLVQHMQTCHQFDQCLSCSLCQECFPNKTSFVVHRRLAHAAVTDIMCTACQVGFEECEIELHNAECDGIQYMTASSDVSLKHAGSPYAQDEQSPAKKSRLDNGLDIPEMLNPQHLSVQEQKQLLHSLYKEYDNDQDSFQSAEISPGGLASFKWHQPVDASPSKKSSPIKSTMPLKELASRARIGTHMLVPNGRQTVIQAKGPFRCGLCDILTFDLTEFTKHNMDSHWRHVCPFCAQTFATRRNVKRHMRKHTGEQPYTCTICDKSFYRDDDLRRHKVLHERTTYYSPRPNLNPGAAINIEPKFNLGQIQIEFSGQEMEFTSKEFDDSPESSSSKDQTFIPETGTSNKEKDKTNASPVTIKVEAE